MTKEKWQGHIAILCTNLIFGLNTPTAKSLVPTWISPTALTCLRMSFATVIFWIIASFFKQEKVSKKDLVVIFFGALFGLVGAQLSFAVALQYTSPVNISLIAAMTPVAVMIMAAFWLKEPITFKKAAGVFIGAAGALLIILHSSPANNGSNNMLGNLLAVVNVITYALYLIITRTVSLRYKPITLMKWMFLFSTLVLLPFTYRHVLDTPAFQREILNMQELGAICFVLIGATFIPYLLIPMSLKRIRPTTISMYNYAQPLVAATLAILMGQDRLTWDKPVAAVLVFTGVYLVTQSKSRADMERSSGK